MPDIYFGMYYVTNQPFKANSAFCPFGIGKWVPASAGKANAGMVYSVIGWTQGVQVKLWDSLRTLAIPERLRDVFTNHDKVLYKSTFTFTLPLHWFLFSNFRLWCSRHADRQTDRRTDATKKRLLDSAYLDRR